jgi:tetratricopeptide (TPR) repeat protein
MKKISRFVFPFFFILQMTVASYSEPNSTTNIKKASYYAGLEYAIHGKFKKAKNEFEKAEKNPGFTVAAANCLSVIKRMEDKKIKSDTAVHFFRGTDFLNKNKIDDAITEFSLAIFINLKCANAYNSRGYAYARKKQYDDAIKDYSKAIEIQPDYVSAYNNRGNIYCEEGDYGPAVEDYTNAIKLSPENADAYNNRGFVYIVKLKDREAGCADLERACSLGGCRNYKLAIQKGYCQKSGGEKADE